MPTDRVPRLCRHKAAQQAYVTLNGHEHYLGPWPANKKLPPPEAKQQYDALIQRWLAHGRTLPEHSPQPSATPAGVSVNEMILAYVKHAKVYYERDGSLENTQYGMIVDAVRIVKRLYGMTPAAEFGPKKLKTVQQAMTEQDWSRNYLNEQVNRLKRMVKWAVSEEMVPGGLYHALQAVPCLKRGTPGVRENEPVRPVAEETAKATLPHLSPHVNAMVRIQQLTGMRPGEVCLLRACDLDMSKPVWLYRPHKHKTQHHEKHRVIPIGPQAQEVIREWLPLNTQAYLFSPRALEEAHNALRRQRQSPMTPSQAKRKRKANPKRRKRDHYDETSYRNAVYRACDLAFPPPDTLSRQKDETEKEWLERLTDEQKEAVKRWRSEHRWHPNQLRHSYATKVRGDYGLEAAQVLLGHSKANITEAYAERDLSLGVTVAGKIG